LKAETATLNSSRDKAEQDSANAKNLVSKLNKEVSTQKSSIEAFKKALEKEKQDKEKLVKSAQSNVAANKKIIEAQAAAKKCEEALKAKTTEFESEKNVSTHVSLSFCMCKMTSQFDSPFSPLSARRVVEDHTDENEESNQDLEGC
jgi:chromosome segregation ATPase